MKPTQKAPGIDSLLQDITGRNREQTIRSATCVFCDTPNMNFRTPLDKKEYTISGLCQDCQDGVFGHD